MDLAVETPARCTVYRRRPERTTLYRAVQGHLETYLALAREGTPMARAPRSTWRGSFAAIWSAASSPTASPRPVRGVRARFPGCLFLQRPRGMPLVQRPAHGRDSRPSGRSGLPATAGAPVVLSVPKRLRYFVQRDPEALGAALHILLRVIEARLRQTQRLLGRAAGGGELA